MIERRLEPDTLCQCRLPCLWIDLAVPDSQGPGASTGQRLGCRTVLRDRSLRLLRASATGHGSPNNKFATEPSRRPPSASILASSLEHLVISVLGTLFFVLVAEHTPLLDVHSRSTNVSVLIGVTMAFFGERALKVASESAAKNLGLPVASQIDTEDLQQLLSGDVSVRLRLREEGISSVWRLAGFLTPRLFINTPLSLEQVCDLQDKAILFDVLGPAQYKLLHDYPGANSLCRASVFLAALENEELDRITTMLALGNSARGGLVCGLLENDTRIKRIRCYRNGKPSVARRLNSDG